MAEIRKPHDSSKLKLKVRKRTFISGKNLKEGPLSPLSNSLSGKLGNSGGILKRKNPFLLSNKQAKCAKHDARSGENKENEFSNFSVARGKAGLKLESCPQASDNGKTFGDNDGKSDVPVHETIFRHQKSTKGFPTDWSLKTKVKFKSDKRFSWCANVKSTVSSRGTVNFVRCLPISDLDDTTDKDMNIKIDFRKNLSYWRHPSLPCIPNFPLLESETNSLERTFTNICKDVAIKDNIMKAWIHSFQSVFTLTRCGFCPYFYMCSQKFNCLFIGTGVLSEEIIGVVTPTTRGLRELLQKEGIEFEMPHLKTIDKSHLPAEDSSYGIENGADDTDEEFLSSIGLNKKNFSSLEKQRFANELSLLNFVDNRTQSTVLIKGSHVNALFNFLLNSDVIVAQSGAFQGVPPTLLAPVAFDGASLQTLQCVQGPVKVAHKGGMKQINCLEISGPVLPTHFYNICQLVKEANDSFDASIYTYSQSNAFNCKYGCEKTLLVNNKISELGISKDSFEYLQNTSLNNSEALARLQLSNGSFEWEVHSL